MRSYDKCPECGDAYDPNDGGCETCKEAPSSAGSAEAVADLQAIRDAVGAYHEALRAREHGGLAQDKCIKRIEDILGVQF